MSSTALYKAFIEVGASQDSRHRGGGGRHSSVTATSNWRQSPIMKSEIAGLKARLVKWMVGSLFEVAGIIIASVGILIQTWLSPGVLQ